MSQFPRWHKSLKTDFYSTYTTLYLFLLELQKEPNPTPFLHISWQDLGGEHLACCVRSKLPFSVCTVCFSSPESKSTTVPTHPTGIFSCHEETCRGFKHFHRKRERSLFVLLKPRDIPTSPSLKKIQTLKALCAHTYLKRPLTSTSIFEQFQCILATFSLYNCFALGFSVICKRKDGHSTAGHGSETSLERLFCIKRCFIWGIQGAYLINHFLPLKFVWPKKIHNVPHTGRTSLISNDPSITVLRDISINTSPSNVTRVNMSLFNLLTMPPALLMRYYFNIF